MTETYLDKNRKIRIRFNERTNSQIQVANNNVYYF